MDNRIKSLELTSWELKWIALVTMLVDHIGAVFYPFETVFRIIGRISFPVFCFLLVEGFCHTHDLKKYLKRMFVFALFSEIPFDFAFYGTWMAPEHQNVMFTFFLALVLLAVLQNTASTVIKLLACAGVMFVSYAVHTDYSFFGILLVLIFYFFYEEKNKKFLIALFANVGCGGLQAWGALALPFLAFYKGNEGRRMKYLFYIFYPAHLLLLGMVREYWTG